MADQTQRDEGNEQRPSTSGSALSFRSPGGTEFSTNDPWTARISVIAAPVVAIYAVNSVVSLFRENPEVLRMAFQLAVNAWDAVVNRIRAGSIIVDLNFESKEKFLKFKKDLDDGKVKIAMEKALKEIGCNDNLELTLMEEFPKVATIEMSKEHVIRETKKIMFVNPNPEDESAGEKKVEKKSNEKADKQEEESGSAAKKPKLDCVVKPETLNSGVSSVSKKKKIMKEGIVSDDDLQTLGKAIGNKWDRLARRLEIKEDEIEEIEDRYKALSQRGHQMLRLWKTNNADAADYKTLHDALVHNMVQRRDLAEQYCFE